MYVNYQEVQNSICNSRKYKLEHWKEKVNQSPVSACVSWKSVWYKPLTKQNQFDQFTASAYNWLTILSELLCVIEL